MTKKSGDADTTYDDTYVGWVETMGYAMIDYATLSIGQNEIERITGDQMQIMNELMSSDKGKQVQTVGTTGRSLVALRGDQVPIKNNTHARTEYKWRNKHYKSPRLVLDEGKACPGSSSSSPLASISSIIVIAENSSDASGAPPSTAEDGAEAAASA